MKRTITMLIAGLFPLLATAQGELPVTVLGEMNNTGQMKSVSEVYLRAGNTGSAAIENNGTLAIPSGITFNVNANADGLLLNKGSVTAPSDPGLVRISKKMDEYRWYNISLPFDVLVSSITDGEGNQLTLDVDYYMNYYDSESRAKYGTWNSNGQPISHWAWVEDPSTILKKGVGYQIAYDNTRHPDGLEVAFPAQNASDVTKLFSTSNTDKVVELDYFTSTNTGIRNTSWGLNFVGMLTTANVLMHTDHLGDYVGWVQYYDEAQKNYIAIDIESNSPAILPPYASFFTQTASAGEEIIYEQTGLRLTAAETGIRSSTPDNADIFALSLRGDNNYSDRIKVYSGSSYNEEFYSKEDVIKFLSSAPEVPKVWIKKENESLLIDKAPYRDVKKFALGVAIDTPGDYIFSPEAIYEGAYEQVLLTDNSTGMVTDLLEEEYPFSVTSKFSSNERFSLEMILKTTTGINDPGLASVSIWANNRTLYVEGCRAEDVISVYAATGQLIGTYAATGSNFSQTLPMEGALIVKVTGERGSKVAKIINK